MIRRLKNEEIEFVMGIWKKENIRAHDFIIEDYWNSNYEKVKSIITKSRNICV